MLHGHFLRWLTRPSLIHCRRGSTTHAQLFVENVNTETRRFPLSATRAQAQMLAAMDSCVRSLHPHTEAIGRESYRDMLEGPGAAKWTHAGDNFFRIFAELGLTHHHWEVLRKLWIQALLHSPYQEVGACVCVCLFERGAEDCRQFAVPPTVRRPVLVLTSSVWVRALLHSPRQDARARVCVVVCV
jgi:hypothetical protein